MDGKCDRCGEPMRWVGSIRDGHMECSVLCDLNVTFTIDCADGMSYSTYTWIVPDEFYESDYVKEMLARGCRVIKESDLYKPDPAFKGQVGVWDGITIVTDEFHGD